jgi:autotransporter-associated beta strand protein
MAVAPRGEGGGGAKRRSAGNFINNGVAAGSGGQLFLRGDGDGDFRCALPDQSSGSITLAKDGNGTWTLSGTNTFTGRTIINTGTLAVNGALRGSSSVIVQFGANLSGTGWITGAITNLGTVFPGADGTIGTLTISNLLFCDSGGLIVCDAGTNGNDQIRGLTTVIYDGMLRVVLSGPLSGNCVFKLFDATNYVGVFASFDLPDITPLTWDTSFLAVDGTLRAVGAPVVSSSFTHIVAGPGGGISLSGTGTLVAPFGILASTNVAAPLSGWVNVGGGTFTNGSFIFTDTAATNFPRRFYQLTTPVP